MILTAMKVRHAAEACGYRIKDGALDRLVSSAALSRDDIDPARSSPALARQIAADADAYQGDKDGACTGAWERFGPDGAPGIRDLLGR